MQTPDSVDVATDFTEADATLLQQQLSDEAAGVSNQSSQLTARDVSESVSQDPPPSSNLEARVEQVALADPFNNHAPVSKVRQRTDEQLADLERNVTSGAPRRTHKIRVRFNLPDSVASVSLPDTATLDHAVADIEQSSFDGEAAEDSSASSSVSKVSFLTMYDSYRY